MIKPFVAMVVIAILAPRTRATDKSLVAHWDFREGQGNALHDSSGHGNNGVIKGARWVKDSGGYALEFDGIDDHVDCGAGPSLDLRESVSLLAWAYPEPRTTGGEPGIVGKAFGSYVITQFLGAAYTYISGGPNFATSALPSGGWRHLASTYDGKCLRLFVDGQLACTTALNLAIQPGGRFWIGRSDGETVHTQDAHFRGKVTEVRVYREALAHEDILHHLRTTRLTNSVEIGVLPLPWRKQIWVEVGKRGLGPTIAADLRVELSALDARGKPHGPPLLAQPVKDFDTAGRAGVGLNAASLSTGQYRVMAGAYSPSGEPIGSPASATFAWDGGDAYPSGPPGARKLNNLVTELLNVRGPDRSGGLFAFTKSRLGWTHFSNNGPDLRIIPAAGGQPLTVALTDAHDGAREAMRLLPAGQYVLETDLAGNLTVREIPDLHYAYYQSNPPVLEFGKLQGEFHRKYVIPNITTFCGEGGDIIDSWVRGGKRWLAAMSFMSWPRDARASESAIKEFFANFPPLAQPQYAGVIADEFGNSDPTCSAWARAMDSVLSNPPYQGKMFFPYAGNLTTGPDGLTLIRTVANHGGAVLCERYQPEQRTEAQAWRFLNAELVDVAKDYREAGPGGLGHLMVNLGVFAGPPESLDIFPHVNYKTYLDMQFNVLANSTAFDGLRGIQSYEANWSDEETVRWTMRLFRHYAIEGRTDMLGRDPYILPHLANGDFEEHARGWSLAPVEPGSIRCEVSPGFGWLQGRYPRTSAGDTVLVTRRSASGPNSFSQVIKDLEPGRSYCLRMYVADFRDMSTREKQVVSITLANVALDADGSFTHLGANCYTHHFGPYDDKKQAWMNYEWRVFRASSPTALLTVCDWADDKRPGGPIGQELMYNFIQVQPYLER